MMPSIRNVKENCHCCLAASLQCAQFTSHLLHSKLFATMDFFKWTTLPTVSSSWDPVCRQCWSVVRKARLKILYSRYEQLNRKVKNALASQDTIWKNESVTESLWLFLYRSWKTFCSPLVRNNSGHLGDQQISLKYWLFCLLCILGYYNNVITKPYLMQD